MPWAVTHIAHSKKPLCTSSKCPTTWIFGWAPAPHPPQPRERKSGKEWKDGELTPSSGECVLGKSQSQCTNRKINMFIEHKQDNKQKNNQSLLVLHIKDINISDHMFKKLFTLIQNMKQIKSDPVYYYISL